MICLVASMNVDYPCKIKDCTCNIIGINIHPCAAKISELHSRVIVEELKDVFALAYIF